MIAIDDAQCSGCAVCAKVCPHGVIAVRDEQAYLVGEERCIECGACQLNCSKDAVQVSKGTGCLVAIVRDDILKLNRAGCGSDSCC